MIVLVDSNAYLRIARNIHPLLGRPFGNIPYLLKIHLDFEEEYNANSRLKTKFVWVNTPEFKSNRDNNKIEIPNYGGNLIIEFMPFLKLYKRENNLSISNIDIWALSTAKALNIPIFTDDPDMLSTAEEFEITSIKTIAFLKYLLDNSEVDQGKLLEIFSFWQYDDDCPTGYNADLSKHLPEIKALLDIGANPT